MKTLAITGSLCGFSESVGMNGIGTCCRIHEKPLALLTYLRRKDVVVGDIKVLGSRKLRQEQPETRARQSRV